MSASDQFAANLDAFLEEDVPEYVRDVRNAIALEALKGVVMLTPWKTGRLRGNWQVTTGSPAEGFDWDLADKQGFATIARGTRALEAAVRAYDIIWVANNLPYAYHVDKGTAKVPAVHMVGQTVSRLQRWWNG